MSALLHSLKESSSWRWALLLAVALLLCDARSEEKGERDLTFVRAHEAFLKATTPEQNRQAAAMFESLLSEDYVNGALYYNAGNAYFKAGDYGKAINAYRKAKLLRPRDPYLDANLKQALSVAPGHLMEAPAPWWKNVLFWSDMLSYPEKFQATFAAWMLSALLTAAAFLTRSRKVYVCSGVAVLLSMLLSLETTISYVNVEKTPRGVVIKEAIARKGSNESYEPAFDQPLKEGAEFTVIARSGEWVFGQFYNIGDGWLRRDSVAE